MGVFINLTNHPSKCWDQTQLKAAAAYGTRIIDIPFPAIDPTWTGEQLDKKVEEYLSWVLQYGDPVVLLQGEFLFTFRMVTKLKEAGITVLSARCSREAVENTRDDGTVEKVSTFNFVSFMEY